VERPDDTPKLLTCRQCGEPLARATPTGVYPLDGVRVYVEQGRMRMECGHCHKRLWWPLRLAA